MLAKINDDIKLAMKAKEADKLAALRMLKSALIENSTSTAPKAEFDVVASYYKKLQSNKEAFPEGSEHRDKIDKEAAFIQVYLPEPYTEDEVKGLIAELTAADDSLNFGGVMKALSPKIKGRFDGKKASELVKAHFG